MKKNNLPFPARPAAPPKPVKKTITVTKQQMAGVVARQSAINLATQNLNQFLSGVVAGEGFETVQVVGYDEAKGTIDIVLPPAAKG